MKNLILMIFFWISAMALGQSAENKSRVGINTSEPKATLDIEKIELYNLPVGYPQGVSFPNFTTTQRSLFTNVKEGTMIYNTTENCLELFNGTAWKCLAINP